MKGLSFDEMGQNRKFERKFPFHTDEIMYDLFYHPIDKPEKKRPSHVTVFHYLPSI